MPASPIVNEVALFRRLRETERARAAQRVALLSACGIDLDKAEKSTGEQRAGFRRRIAVKIERERLKGASGHWGYSLDRHIALSQALRTLRAPGESKGRRTAPP